METQSKKNRRLKLKTKTTTLTKQDCASTGRQEQEWIPDKKSKVEHVIEILDDTDSADNRSQAAAEKDKSVTTKGKQKQVPWESLPDLPSYKPVPHKNSDDTQPEIRSPIDDLPPLPKSCSCTIRRKKRS
ncbi:hypothetical protein BaRGS_00015020 [Batillaria attramentaria]|uniref:Uncharacterized protein n=1 Tax=Batillaria attramentaria TaxID=370345 RepID=A0ABD0L2F2_9CAEN